MERVLQERLHSTQHHGLAYIIDKKELDNDCEVCDGDEKTLKYRKLAIDFDTGEDPDAAYSIIPYQKGANLLFYLGLFCDCLVLLFLILIYNRGNSWRIKCFQKPYRKERHKGSSRPHLLRFRYTAHWDPGFTSSCLSVACDVFWPGPERFGHF